MVKTLLNDHLTFKEMNDTKINPNDPERTNNDIVNVISNIRWWKEQNVTKVYNKYR